MELTLAQIFNLLKYATTVKEILDVATSNADTFEKLQKAAAPVFKILQGIGSSIFPDATDQMKPVGAAIAAYDSAVVKWVQEGCNNILELRGRNALAVDGIYGPLTRDAVKQVQTKLGLPTIDGVAGRLTQAAMDAWFGKQSK